MKTRRRSAFRINLPTIAVHGMQQCSLVHLTGFERSLLVKLLQYALYEASYSKPLNAKFDEVVEGEVLKDTLAAVRKLEAKLIMGCEHLEHLKHLACLCKSPREIALENDQYVQDNLIPEYEGTMIAGDYCYAVNASYQLFVELSEYLVEIIDVLTDYALASGVVMAAVTTLAGGLLPIAVLQAAAGAIVDYGVDFLSRMAINHLKNVREEIVCAVYSAAVDGRDTRAVAVSEGMKHQIGPITSMVLGTFMDKKHLKVFRNIPPSRVSQSAFVDCASCAPEGECHAVGVELTWYLRQLTQPSGVRAMTEKIAVVGPSGLVVARLMVSVKTGSGWSEPVQATHIGGLVFEAQGIKGKIVKVEADGGGTVEKICFVR